MKQPMLINRPFFDTIIKNDKDYMERVKDLYKKDPIPGNIKKIKDLYRSDPLSGKHIPIFDETMHKFNMNILQKLGYTINKDGEFEEVTTRRKLDRKCFTGKKDRRAKER